MATDIFTEEEDDGNDEEVDVTVSTVSCFL